MRFFLTLLLALPLLVVPAAQSDDLQEGRDYWLLEPVQTPRVPAGKIEVIEFFNYSCPHCFRLQPHFNRWLRENAGDDVAVVHQPVVFQRYRGHFARAYYTLVALGVDEEYNAKVYDALHVQKKLINSKDRFLDWLEEEGMDRDKAEKVYDSFSVSSRAARAENIAADYGVDSTPQIVVAGKYLINAQLSGSNKKLMEHLTLLVERERQG